MAAPKKVDYERIEPGWRAGIKSPAQLAAEYTESTGVEVSRAAIIQHFSKLGVPRNLNAKIQAKADAMVAESMVTGKVSVVTTKRDSEIIESVAVGVATVRLSHRTDIQKSKQITNKLLEELNTADPKITPLKERSQILKQLVDSQKVVVSMEREAFGMAQMVEDPTTLPAAKDDMEYARRIAFALTRAAELKGS